MKGIYKKNRPYLNKVKKEINNLLSMESLCGRIQYKLDIPDRDIDNFLADLKDEKINGHLEDNFLYPNNRKCDFYIVLYN